MVTAAVVAEACSLSGRVVTRTSFRTGLWPIGRLPLIVTKLVVAVAACPLLGRIVPRTSLNWTAPGVWTVGSLFVVAEVVAVVVVEACSLLGRVITRTSRRTTAGAWPIDSLLSTLIDHRVE